VGGMPARRVRHYLAFLPWLPCTQRSDTLQVARRPWRRAWWWGQDRCAEWSVTEDMEPEEVEGRLKGLEGREVEVES